MRTLFILLLFAGVSGSILAQDGSTLRYADLSGERPKGNYTSYISKSGTVYKIGDTLKIGSPSGSNNQFVHVERQLLLGQRDPADAKATNMNIVLKDISVFSAGGFNKTAGYKVQFLTTGSFASSYAFKIEDALDAGEIKSFGKTSDEALAELKKAKDKLDLGLITQTEFDAVREELKKYIK